ncbi:MAG TPA: lytic transglycosylase domain-containing protein [Nitrospiraceae bacterium]|nr:lytic transglycosylase domain-containing protein [Nitrospiraceae bacterium]
MNQPRYRLGQSVMLAAFVTLLVSVISVLPPVARGEVYQYIDQEGTIHLTNVPSDPRFKKIHTESTNLHPRVPTNDLERAILRYAREHRLHPALLRAVIKAESDFDPTATSKAGAVGLMQLMPETAVKLDVRDPYDPDENIAGGARHLRYLLDRFNGNLALALAAYNAGEHRVEQYRTLPPIDETRLYVTKVLRFYRAFLFSGHRTSSYKVSSSVRVSRSQPLSTWTP